MNIRKTEFVKYVLLGKIQQIVDKINVDVKNRKGDKKYVI